MQITPAHKLKSKKVKRIHIAIRITKTILKHFFYDVKSKKKFCLKGLL
jgi:hypothetical protein